MISVDYCRLLARYNRWMNERLYATAGELTAAERERDRGAFFGSIHRTLNHILWGDRVWLGRFTGTPFGAAAYGADMHGDFATLSCANASAPIPQSWTGPADSRPSGSRRRSNTAPRPTVACAACPHGSRPPTCSSTRRITAGRCRRC